MNHIVYRSILFILCVLLAAHVIRAQEKALPAVDSVQTIPDTLLFKIQKAQAAVAEVNAANKKGYNVGELRNSLLEIKATVLPLKKDLGSAGKNYIENKRLLSYNLILKDAGEALNSLRTVLIKHNAELQRLSQNIVNLSSDTLLSVTAADSGEKKLYAQPLKEIKFRLNEAGNLTGKNLEDVL